MVDCLFFFFRKKLFCFENGENITIFDRIIVFNDYQEIVKKIT